MLVRDDPVSGRLELLELAVISLDKGQISSILFHASTLTYPQTTYRSFDFDDNDDEDDEDSDDGDTGNEQNSREEMALVLRFLVGCRYLRRFILNARVILTLEVFCGRF
jgi:hypothetical protein